MFNVGGLELLAIALVALVVLGPDKLPAALRQAGSALGQLRRMSDAFRIDVTAALTDDAAERPGADLRVD
ncbi:twin-arginine translocase TatA/TatE family subunit [Acidimicrobiia bacterium EGI L10123]|uniref:Sec-independent protein translocase subunit TatA/TatB n=1 Tax=Salinilacustrithrix flava TaxID=2957203 RepID=UPI003D7C23BF|nr:twin-arginine translocase TatA/TatE family subunit [Acidimicrobiia bacterium EGI L10123]